MKIYTLYAIASALQCAVAAAQVVHEVHGSGTTNPSKCFWSIMSLFEARSKVPIRMTYRAVGSSTGIAEFVGDQDDATSTYKPLNNFGSGDIPLSKENWDKVQSDGGAVHLPFLIGGVSFFHNIPHVDTDEVGGLNLTGCLLARIFSREIRNWNHEDILDLNPHMKLPSGGLEITVARRVKGSSSTASITGYLKEKCPDKWDEAGSTITWSLDTEQCQGSGGMTACIRDKEGAIGYIDAGHGWDEGLKEVRLEITKGNFKTSKELDDVGGFANAAEEAAALSNIPSSASADFSGVHLLNQPGENTWPIVVMSYVYVRTEPTKHMTNDVERGLLKLFLESLYDDNYIKLCAEHGFSMVPEKVKNLGQTAIKDTINWSLADEHTWSFEYKSTTLAKAGMGDYVISGKRRSFYEYEISRNEDIIEKLHEELKELREVRQFTRAEHRRLDSAYILSVFSMCIWATLLLAYLLKQFFFRGTKHTYSLGGDIPESS